MLAAVALLVAACGEQSEGTGDAAEPVRGLVTTVVRSAEQTTIRRYPGVLEPGEITSLSFEVTGKLGRLDLSVGQRVSEGELLAELDSERFLVAIENRSAAVEEAAAALAQAEENLTRSEELLQRGAGTRVTRDQDRTEVTIRRAQHTQAEKDLATAQEDLTDTRLYAPFDGIINSVDVESFATVSAGTLITSLYEGTSYEVSFSVNFDTVGQLVVGTPAAVRMADDPEVVLNAVISELGERADTVSSFPVVVTLEEDSSFIRAGMAVEVSFEFKLPAAAGYLIPISAAIPEGQIPDGAGPNAIVPVTMYVYDPETATVRRREVVTAGMRENKFLIIDGLEEGEHVAVAGVSFLREGMTVRLLEPRE